MNEAGVGGDIRAIRASGSDCFVHAMESVMRRKGQGSHLSLAVLELDAAPDISALRGALAKALERHPLLTAELRAAPLCPPKFRPATNAAPEVGLHLWKEEGAVAPQGWQQSAPAPLLMQRVLNLPDQEFASAGYCNIRADLVALAEGGCLFSLAWRHIILDGVGVELLVREIADPRADRAAGVQWDSKEEPLRFRKLWANTAPVVTHMYKLLEKRYRSLGGRKPRPCGIRFDRLRFDEAETARAKARSAEICGPLIQSPFFLACATRAHHRVFEHRGDLPPSYVANVPAQLRKRSARGGPVFQNFVSMIMLSATPDETSSLERLSNLFQDQQNHFLKKRLGRSFDDLLRLMRRVPPKFYVGFIRLQMKGELNTFYHAMTGEFAPGLDGFHGAEVTDAWHVPSVYQPPGTGIFMSEKSGRLSAVISWREGSISDQEKEIIAASLRADLLGEEG